MLFLDVFYSEDKENPATTKVIQSTTVQQSYVLVLDVLYAREVYNCSGSAVPLKVQCVKYGLIYDFYLSKSLPYCPYMH